MHACVLLLWLWCILTFSGLQEPITYWSKVTGQLVKQVYLKEKMSPPSMTEFESVYKSLYKSLSTGEFVSAARNMNAKQVVQLSADGLIIYGFFVFGEMVGRRNVVGYKD